MFKYIGQRHTVDDADGDLAYNTGLEYFCGDPFCKRKEKKERNDDEDLDS
jgi:hypothetical protein